MATVSELKRPVKALGLRISFERGGAQPTACVMQPSEPLLPTGLSFRIYCSRPQVSHWSCVYIVQPVTTSHKPAPHLPTNHVAGSCRIKAWTQLSFGFCLS